MPDAVLPEEPDPPQQEALLASPGEMAPLGGAAQVAAPGRWHAAVRALHYPAYRMVWTGSLVSNIGSWMQTVAVGWLIVDELHLKNPARWLGINAFAQGLPVVLLLPFTGVLADRADRRVLIGATSCCLGLIAATLALLHGGGHLRVEYLTLASACNGVMMAVSLPAYQSLMPTLVEPRDLSNAVALNSLQFNTSRVLGPAVGGAVLAAGATWSFSLNAVSFLAVILAVCLVRRTGRGAPHGEDWRQSLNAGVSYLRSRPDLLTMILLVVVASFCASPLLNMLPELVKNGFGREAGGYSALLSCFGCGAVAGAVLLAMRSRREPTPWRAFPILVGLGLCEMLMGLTPWFISAFLLITLAGGAFVGTNARLNTALLGSTPDHVRGRISSFFMLAFMIGMPLGGLVSGAAADRFGARLTFVLFGAVLMAAAGLFYLAARRAGIRYAGTAARHVHEHPN